MTARFTNHSHATLPSDPPLTETAPNLPTARALRALHMLANTGIRLSRDRNHALNRANAIDAAFTPNGFTLTRTLIDHRHIRNNPIDPTEDHPLVAYLFEHSTAGIVLWLPPLRNSDSNYLTYQPSTGQFVGTFLHAADRIQWLTTEQDDEATNRPMGRALRAVMLDFYRDLTPADAQAAVMLGVLGGYDLLARLTQARTDLPIGPFPHLHPDATHATSQSLAAPSHQPVRTASHDRTLFTTEGLA